MLLLLLALPILTILSGCQRKDFQHQYEQRIESGGDVLDLSSIEPGVWDEMLVWTPYANICDYGIEGFKPGGKNCESTVQDTDCFLLFLKNNRLVAKVNPKRVNFCWPEPTWKRIAATKSMFRIEGNRPVPVK